MLREGTMSNNWAIVGDRGPELIGPEDEMRRIWKKIDDGTMSMPHSHPLINYRILVEIKDVRR